MKSKTSSREVKDDSNLGVSHENSLNTSRVRHMSDAQILKDIVEERKSAERFKKEIDNDIHDSDIPHLNFRAT